MSFLKSQIKELLSNQRAKLGVIQGVRPFKKGATGKCISFFWSIKNGKHLMPCESRLEAAHALMMEFENDIKSYFLQPLTIKFKDGGRYTPDAMVIHTDGRITFREVKPAAHLDSENVMDLMDRAYTFFNHEGFQHEIRTDENISLEHTHLDREFVYANLKLPVTAWEMNEARVLFQRGFKASIFDCYSLLKSKNLPFQLVEHLLFECWFTYDERYKLNTESLLEVK
ncbi:hypothetical protein E8Q33_08720 [Methylophaga sp. SB9B]|jgi:hypothetical protein|uniref:TnsA endonuclease N-terminal domain-containing protein n=1 Tax=Methylophaga sp. SB9B TaxID=2570356 RepID=UPI0010A899B9|nr:TnsA endonuclease N-terminal domain-containing protein [Methylophaga sp. SB9B]THK41194.1 hypothetical protein E8Q33_08720 [Methylophaga sp. SB9B]